jgi:hypothetical protein
MPRRAQLRDTIVAVTKRWQRCWSVSTRPIALQLRRQAIGSSTWRASLRADRLYRQGANPATQTIFRSGKKLTIPCSAWRVSAVSLTLNRPEEPRQYYRAVRTLLRTETERNRLSAILWWMPRRFSPLLKLRRPPRSAHKLSQCPRLKSTALFRTSKALCFLLSTYRPPSRDGPHNVDECASPNHDPSSYRR